MMLRLVLILSSIWTFYVESYGGFDSGTPGCDTAAALQCEVSYLFHKFKYKHQTTACFPSYSNFTVRVLIMQALQRPSK